MYASSGGRLVIGIWILLTAATVSLFFLPSEAVAVFASGAAEGGGSFFGLVSGWIS